MQLVKKEYYFLFLCYQCNPRSRCVVCCLSAQTEQTPLQAAAIRYMVRAQDSLGVVSSAQLLSRGSVNRPEHSFR